MPLCPDRGTLWAFLISHVLPTNLFSLMLSWEGSGTSLEWITLAFSNLLALRSAHAIDRICSQTRKTISFGIKFSRAGLPGCNNFSLANFTGVDGYKVIAIRQSFLNASFGCHIFLLLFPVMAAWVGF